MSYSTKQREELVSFLEKHADEPLSVKQIAEGLKEKDISVSAVYRNISRLEKEGAVARIAKLGTNEDLFKYTLSKKCANCIHLTCTECGKTYHLENNETKKMEQGLQTNNGFYINKTKTVIYGVCKKCNGIK